MIEAGMFEALVGSTIVLVLGAIVIIGGIWWDQR